MDSLQPASPVEEFDAPSNSPAAVAAAAAKKKKKKGKAKRADDSLDSMLPPPNSNHSFAATAQAQADLIATASDLYRRIEADPQGIPDDDAYWTSLPAHLRTFIRNALPIGQLPPSAQANPNDPNSRQTSTQAMIAVAQQLAQAAHASQRHLQNHPSANLQHGNTNANPYPPFPFDPSIFADLALHADQPLPLHPHPNSTPNGPNGNSYAYSHANPPPTQPPGEPLPAPVVLVNEHDDERGDFEDDYYSDEELDSHEMDSREAIASLRHETNGLLPPDSLNVAPSSKKKNKKKKKKGGGGGAPADPAPLQPPAPTTRVSNAPTAPTQQLGTNNLPRQSNIPPPPPSSRAAGKQPMTFNHSGGKAPVSTARPSANGVQPGGKRPGSMTASSHGHGSVSGHHIDERSWSPSNVEERERIKSFWLQLGEKERKNLIATEKGDVLRRMREQQRHGCTCSVCIRKRHSIEVELELMYHSYYVQLERYAEHQRRHMDSNGEVPPPPGPGPFPGSIAMDSTGHVIGGNMLTKTKRGHVHQPSVLGKRTTLPPEEDDEYDEDDLEEDEYEEDYDYDDEEDEEDELDSPDFKARRRLDEKVAARRAKDFFNQGSSLTVKGILTVADDLLRNDGQKFLEMMEQLAERRAEQKDDGSREEFSEDDERENGLDEDAEDLESEALFQRLEEGLRMFQIFAARMFEQRVLQAYRERIAQERQLQLLRELEEEDLAEKEREAKRAKENQKKKDKKKQAKQQKEEERLRIEREKAAEEAAAKEKLEKQREAELKRQEEVRLKREAERKAKEEEKTRKEEEKRKRQEEERSRELEKERKKREKEDKLRREREAKEREVKAKEEEAKRAKESKDAEQRGKRAIDEKQKDTHRPSEKQTPRAPVSPAGAKASRSPSAATLQPSTPNAPRNRSTPTTSPGQSTASAAATAATTGQKAGSRSGSGSSAVSQTHASASTLSSLPAPPQGLPARPVTNVAAPTSSLPASLPRPPQQATAGASIPSAPGQVKANNGRSPALSAAPLQSVVAPTQGSPAQEQAYPSSHSLHGNMSRFGTGGGYNGPPIRSPSGAASNGYIPSMGNNPMEIGSPTSLNASAIGALSLGPVTAPTQVQQPFGPIGGGFGGSNTYSRATSQDEFKAASGAHRPVSRPAPGPIGPIGRPRDASQDESNGTSSLFGSSNAFPEGILGSSALGGDDELVEPQPRRVNHNAPISGSLFGGRAGFGGPSPWGSGASNPSLAGGQQPPSGAGSNVMSGALGSAAPGGPSFGGLNSMQHLARQVGNANGANANGAAGLDPWARAGNGWDQARYAFEQPSGPMSSQSSPSRAQHPVPQQHQSLMGSLSGAPGGIPLSPYSASQHQGLRNLFGAPGSGAPHGGDRGM